MIRQDVVLAMHEEALAQHGGPSGVRDLGLLESALGRPKNLFAYSEEPVSLAQLAAAYARELPEITFRRWQQAHSIHGVGHLSPIERS